MGDETNGKKTTTKKGNKTYKKGDAKKNTTPDLSTFKPKDVALWEKTERGERKVSSGGNLSFGGAHLKGSRMRLHRKKNNRSTRG